jgi:hypothetical protein
MGGDLDSWMQCVTAVKENDALTRDGWNVAVSIT